VVTIGSDREKTARILKNNDCMQEKEIESMDFARAEMKRIFRLLHFPQDRIEETMLKFKTLHACIHDGCKFRKPKKLVPITIYYHLKSLGMAINAGQLVAISSLTMREFQAFTSQIKRFRSTRTSKKTPEMNDRNSRVENNRIE